MKDKSVKRTGLFTLLGLTSALALTPSLASASNYCERDKHDQKVTGTLIGALGGALLGNAIAGHGHRGDGALVGAASGAIIGNQLSRSKEPCPYGYHYADDYRVVEHRTYYDAPPPPSYGYGYRTYAVPPPPPRYGYGYKTYYAPPPPPPAYDSRWRFHRHHEDEDDDD
jgi:hypothetical protein